MKVHIHQEHQQVADFKTIFSSLTQAKLSAGLHLYPELFLCGYLLKDVVTQKSFIQAYHSHLDNIKSWATTLDDNVYLLCGGLKYELDENSIPKKIFNGIYLISKEGVEYIYSKRLLPSYDIFDESKYFCPGDRVGIIEIAHKKVALLVCEDMWPSVQYSVDPVEELKKLNQQFDLVVNLSASPFALDKNIKRYIRAHEIANHLQAPYAYVNCVSGEEEILFDGASFLCDGSHVYLNLNSFEAQSQSIEITSEYIFEKNINASCENSWENLFQSRFEKASNKIPVIKDWTDEQAEQILKALKFGFKEYARKTGFNKFTIALSGGMDSALVLTVLKLALKKGDYLEAIYMPSIYSSGLSFDLSLALCQKLAVPLKTLPIKFLHSATKNLFNDSYNQGLEGLADENVQSRLRGTLLYTRSNQINSMVINTSNKSELAVGYSTQYGDSVGAISLLGDLYKSEVYQLANYINKKYEQLIPEEIIKRAPSAELREDQKDEDSLPPYKVLDAILEGILSYRYSVKDLIRLGFPSDDVNKVMSLYLRSEYKRRQFSPIIKVSPKSFGFGYRVPLTQHTAFYF